MTESAVSKGHGDRFAFLRGPAPSLSVRLHFEDGSRGRGTAVSVVSAMWEPGWLLSTVEASVGLRNDCAVPAANISRAVANDKASQTASQTFHHSRLRPRRCGMWWNGTPLTYFVARFNCP